MQKIWENAEQSSYNAQQKYSCLYVNIFLVATQRTALPTSEILGLEHATGCIAWPGKRSLLLGWRLH